MTKRLLEELNSIVLNEGAEQIIESKARHVISNAINVIESMYRSLPQEAAYDLEKKMLNAIKSRAPEKFTRNVSKITSEKQSNLRLEQNED
jgi:TPP-dependent indolepyruvate ferredoxin oxidoreductase alpha subunit